MTVSRKGSTGSTDDENEMTAYEGSFTAGDLVNSTADAISAVADRLRAVVGIQECVGVLPAGEGEGNEPVAIAESTSKGDHMEFQSVHDILDFAISKEQEAHDIYAELAKKVERPELQTTFREFAQMELGHRTRLEKIKAGKLPGLKDEAVENLKVSDFLVDVKPQPNMGYQDALLFAMKAEKRAYDLYVGLGNATDDAGLRQVFKGLAQEELKHKHFFETEYDELVLEGN